MIRDFKIEDLNSFEPNEHAHPDIVMGDLAGDEYMSYTLDDCGIMAIISFKDCGDDVYAAFLLIGRDFTARHGIEIKRFLNKMVEGYNPKRLWTGGRCGRGLDKWHKFLGMKKEQVIQLEGEDCEIWGIDYGH